MQNHNFPHNSRGLRVSHTIHVWYYIPTAKGPVDPIFEEFYFLKCIYIYTHISYIYYTYTHIYIYIIYIYPLVYQTLGDNGGSKNHFIRDPFSHNIIPSPINPITETSEDDA